MSTYLSHIINICIYWLLYRNKNIHSTMATKKDADGKHNPSIKLHTKLSQDIDIRNNHRQLKIGGRNLHHFR